MFLLSAQFSVSGGELKRRFPFFNRLVRFHDLRHSAATILLSMGVPAKVVQEILGHSQISLTMDIYSHVLPDMQQQAMDKMNELFCYDILDDSADDEMR